MPSTRRLLRADSPTAVHAQIPGSDRTLCGLDVVEPEQGAAEEFYRAADFTGIRFYNGTARTMCLRCVQRAIRLRPELQGVN